MSETNAISAMDDDEVESALDEIRDKLDDARYPARMKLWAIVKRCDQINADR